LQTDLENQSVAYTQSETAQPSFEAYKTAPILMQADAMLVSWTPTVHASHNSNDEAGDASRTLLSSTDVFVAWLKEEVELYTFFAV